MGNTVKTYRVLHDGLRVGDEVRNFGDFIPEAAQFQNLRSYLNSAYIEEVYVEQEVIDEWNKERMARMEEETKESDDEEPDEDEENTEPEPVKETKAKSKAKSKPKKRTVKKTKKDEGNERRLSEQSV